LDQRAKRGLNGAKILLIGLAYKKNVDDVRESPSLRLIRFIEARGGHAEYYDPFIPEIPKTRDYPDLAGRRSIHWDGKRIASYDAVIIAADHDGIDYKTLAQSAQLIIDTRNALARAGTSSDRLVKA
jgi:UDP-N-acetyl-D-glucosamine dehydrogenase